MQQEEGTLEVSDDSQLFSPLSLNDDVEGSELNSLPSTSIWDAPVDDLAKPGSLIARARLLKQRVSEYASKSMACQELAAVASLAAPVIGSYLSSQSVSLVNLFFVGHLGPTELAAAALGNVYCNVTGWSIGIGLLMAMDTLSSQAFGAKNYHRVGILLQRAILVSLMSCVPVAILWSFTEYLLLLAHQEPEVARQAAIYVKLLIPALPLYFIFECLKRYLIAQSIVAPTVAVSAASVVVNLVANYCFIKIFNWGIWGSGLAMSITYSGMPFMMIALILIFGMHKKTWGGFSWAAFKDWKEFLFLGIPGIIMLCAEWWGFEIHVFLAGLLGTVPLAAHSLVGNCLGILYMVPLAMGIAASTRVGNMLGANDPNRARTASRVSIVIMTIWVLCMAAVIVLVRRIWPAAFSDDQAVIDLVAQVLLLIAFLQIFDGMGGVTTGILRGCGLQKIGAIVNLVAYYALGVPGGAVLAFQAGLGIIGLWLGLTLAAGSAAITFVIVCWRIDWATKAEEAHQRALKEESLAASKDPEGNDSMALELQELQAYDEQEDDDVVDDENGYDEEKNGHFDRNEGREEEGSQEVPLLGQHQQPSTLMEETNSEGGTFALHEDDGDDLQEEEDDDVGNGFEAENADSQLLLDAEGNK